MESHLGRRRGNSAERLKASVLFPHFYGRDVLTMQEEVAGDSGDAGEWVVLVDAEDREIGVAGKWAAHANGGRLHRAVSVFVRDAAGRLLLQRRAREKYHFGGLWTNTCCGHPRPGESSRAAAERRLWEEMGVRLELREIFTFTYAAADPVSGLTEREFDHVFLGELPFGHAPTPDAREVEGWRWVTLDALRTEIAAETSGFTPWFPLALERFLGESYHMG